MKNLIEDFSIPFYIFEDILKYLNNGKPASQRSNLYTLIRVAEKNNRFTKLQADYLIEKLEIK